MQQHPVPQHIASYEFRLIGDMTLKQFGMLAGSCVVALIVYASGLPAYFKWPLVLFFVLLGVGLAFVPIEERPMHQWLIAFFKAVYSPTQFIWRKENQKVVIFESEAGSQPVTSDKPVEKPQADTKQLWEYLSTLPPQKADSEIKGDGFLHKAGSFFDTPRIIETTRAKEELPEKKENSEKPKKEEREIEKQEAVPLPVPPVMAPPPVSEPSLPGMPYSTTVYKQQADESKTVISAKVGMGLPIPQAPKAPNLPVGMVLDPDGAIVEDAILEIRDAEGLPVRALKTNKLGQFRIATPLKNGVYEIEVEKTGFEFDIIKLELVGNPVPLIEIRAKGRLS